MNTYTPTADDKARVDSVSRWAVENIEKIWAYDDYMDTASGRWPSIYKLLRIDGDYDKHIALYQRTLDAFDESFGDDSESHLVAYFLYPAKNPPAYNSTGRHPNPNVLHESIHGSMRQAILYKYLYSDARIRASDLPAFMHRMQYLLQHTKSTGDGEGNCRGMGDFMYNHTPSMAELPQILMRQDLSVGIDEQLLAFVTGAWCIDLDVEEHYYPNTYAENYYAIDCLFYRALLVLQQAGKLTPAIAERSFLRSGCFSPSFNAKFENSVAVVNIYTQADSFFSDGESVTQQSIESYNAIHDYYLTAVWAELEKVKIIYEFPPLIQRIAETQPDLALTGAKWFIRICEILVNSKKKDLEDDAECLCSFLDVKSLASTDSAAKLITDLQAIPARVVQAAMKHAPEMRPMLANLDLHPGLIELNTFVAERLKQGDGHVASVTDAEIVDILDRAPKKALARKEMGKLIRAFEAQRFNYANIARIIKSYDRAA